MIPSMQTLEDVLLLAMKGEDPFVVDALLRKRGDYRPHAHFGVDLAVREASCCCILCAARSETAVSCNQIARAYSHPPHIFPARRRCRGPQAPARSHHGKLLAPRTLPRRLCLLRMPKHQGLDQQQTCSWRCVRSCTIAPSKRSDT